MPQEWGCSTLLGYLQKYKTKSYIYKKTAASSKIIQSNTKSKYKIIQTGYKFLLMKLLTKKIDVLSKSTSHFWCLLVPFILVVCPNLMVHILDHVVEVSISGSGTQRPTELGYVP